jgi:hypothetical protein
VTGGAALAVLALLALLVAEALLARRGEIAPFENPSRAPTRYGDAGPALTYVVLGDSTGAGQGAPPADGIAPATARHLARSRRVTLVNRSVSGARWPTSCATSSAPRPRCAPTWR